MALELDDRQRAMLQEMGVRVWLPGTAFAQAQADQAAPAAPAAGSSAPERPRVGPPARSASPNPPTSPARNAAPVPGAQVQRPATPLESLESQETQAALAQGTVADWPTMQEAVQTCRACTACSERRQPSWYAPALPQADWLVVGDPPDEEEESSGMPFAGDSGVLLGNMLQALGLERINPWRAADDAPLPARERAAYVTSVMKCRRAHGAVPTPEDLAQCSAHLRNEIALLQPRMVLSMGRFAHQVLLASDPSLAGAPLGRLRGSVHRFDGVPVVVTYHPKALLRHTADKAKAWADLCLAADVVQGGPHSTPR